MKELQRKVLYIPAAASDLTACKTTTAGIMTLVI
jgi:hypothetical protein